MADAQKQRNIISGKKTKAESTATLKFIKEQIEVAKKGDLEAVEALEFLLSAKDLISEFLSPDGSADKSIDEIIEGFQKKLSQKIGDDWNEHFKLGIAYKEMGLLDDAINSANTAFKLCPEEKKVEVLVLIGRIYQKFDKTSEANKTYNEALLLARKQNKTDTEDVIKMIEKMLREIKKPKNPKSQRLKKQKS